MATCYKFTYQLIQNLRSLHDMSFVHNDLKLENILVGRSDPNQIYLIDFGLATRWQDPATKVHISKMRTNVFQGNIRFATKHQCHGFKTSRRDDIQSAFYILIYLLNKNQVPWLSPESGLGCQHNVLQWVQNRSARTFNKELVQMTPKGLRKCLVAVLRMQFKDSPPYDQILNCLKQCYEKAVQEQQPCSDEAAGQASGSDLINQHALEWDKSNGSHFQGNLSRQAKICKVSNAAMELPLYKGASRQDSCS